jgi:hypothetical protein
MAERLNTKNFLMITIADALDLFRGRVDQGGWAPTNVVRGFNLVHDPRLGSGQALKGRTTEFRGWTQ